jgi:hypothetical protein
MSEPSVRIGRHPLRITTHAPIWLDCDICQASFLHHEDRPRPPKGPAVAACLSVPKAPATTADSRCVRKRRTSEGTDGELLSRHRCAATARATQARIRRLVAGALVCTSVECPVRGAR